MIHAKQQASERIGVYFNPDYSQDVKSSSKEIERGVLKDMLPVIIMINAGEKEIHGYGSIVEIRKKYGVYFGPSTIYPTLGRLEREGFLVSRLDRQGPRLKKMYKATESGQALVDSLKKSKVMALLAKLAFDLYNNDMDSMM